jgi:glutathione S-transferase
VISFIGNRPALQIGPYQVTDYDVTWLDDALRRAAAKAEVGDFPFLGEIRAAVILYLEHKCPLRLMPLDDLYAKLRRMLEQIGCQPIADQLEPVAPPVTVSLLRVALEAGNGFELALFTTLRGNLAELRKEGAEKVRLVGVRPGILKLRGVEKWTAACDGLLGELRSFVSAWNAEQPAASRRLLVSLESH